MQILHFLIKSFDGNKFTEIKLILYNKYGNHFYQKFKWGIFYA